MTSCNHQSVALCSVLHSNANSRSRALFCRALNRLAALQAAQSDGLCIAIEGGVGRSFAQCVAGKSIIRPVRQYPVVQYIIEWLPCSARSGHSRTQCVSQTDAS